MNELIDRYNTWMLKDGYYTPLLPAYQDMVLNMVTRLDVASLKHIDILVDLGSGLGYSCSVARKINPEVKIVAVDPSRDMLHKLKRQKELRIDAFYNSSAENLENDCPIHPIVMQASFSLHHVKHENKLSVLRYIFNCLQPGGRFGLGDISVDTSIDDPLARFEHIVDFFSYGAKYIARATGNIDYGMRELRFMLEDALPGQNEYMLPAEKWIDLFQQAGFRTMEPYFSDPKALRYFNLIGWKD